MSKKKQVLINPGFNIVKKNNFALNWEKSKNEKYKLYRKKWIDNPQNNILEKGPLHLDIESTNACNLMCPMCPRTIGLRNESDKVQSIGFMRIEEYKNIIDQAAEIGVYAIKLNMLGEPLMHKNIVDMVKYAKEKGIIDVIINTNAVMLDPNLSKNLILAGLDQIIFSFDSPKKETYEKIRVGAKYEEVLNNIKIFNRIREELGGKPTLTRVQIVISEDNSHELDEFIELFQDIVDVIAYLNYAETQYMADESLEDNREVNYNFKCSQLWQRMVILWNGIAVPCCADGNAHYPIGNAFEEKIENLWKNKRYQYLRKKNIEGKYYEVSLCKRCWNPHHKKGGSIY